MPPQNNSSEQPFVGADPANSNPPSTSPEQPQDQAESQTVTPSTSQPNIYPTPSLDANSAQGTQAPLASTESGIGSSASEVTIPPNPINPPEAANNIAIPSTQASEATAAPMGASMSSQQIAGLTQPKQRKLPKKLIVLAAVLFLLGGVSFAALSFIGGGIALEKYEGEGYSLSIPKYYEQNEAGELVSFVEKDDDEDSTSAIVIFSVPANSETQKAEVRKQLDEWEKDGKKALEALADPETTKGEEFANAKTERKKISNHDALIISAEAKEDGKKVANVKFMYLIDEGKGKVYMIGIGAHINDNGLNKSTDKIINSFKTD